MASNDLVKTLLQRLDVQLSCEPRRARYEIKTAVRLQVLEEPQSLLSERQRRVLVVLLRRGWKRGRSLLIFYCGFVGLSKLGNRRTREELAQRQFNVEDFKQSRDELSCQ